ncbi:MAG TPA: EAL domain-containing protein [Frankiaceae bacterium]|nr:EAL domain-containing protein [Frankiaceae bacterium]
MSNDDAAHRLAAIVTAAQDAIFEVGKDGLVTLWNPAAERLFGWSATEAVGMPVARLVPPDRMAESTVSRDAARTGQAPAPYETVRQAKDGTLVPVSIVVSPVRSATGEPESAAVVLRDLRPLAESRAELAASEARFRALVERAGDMFVICTPDAVIGYVSPRLATPGGRDPGELVGMSAFALVHDDDKPFMRAAFAAFAAAPGAHEPVLVRGVDAVGGIRWYHLIATNLVDLPAVGGIVIVVQDVTEQQALRDELALYARHDRLTGFPTRAALPDELARLRERHPGRTAVVVVEVDGVRAVQREAGHVAADAARRALAERLCGAVADGDVVARLGGETFAVVRGGVEDDAAARRLGADVVGAAGEPVAVHGRVWALTATAGVAVSAGADADSLVRDADLARYEAMTRGTGRAELFAPALQKAVSDRMTLTSTLRKGLSEDALRLEFQPAVRLDDGVAVGAEALVRWRAPDGALLAPETFLPAAVASGLMPAVSEWVLRAACAAAAAWRADPLPYVAVNLSARELVGDSIVAAVKYALDAAGLAPERLVLEVNEAAVVREGGLTGVLEALTALGVRVAFDGAGVGSIVYLKRLPVSMLKIGPEFIAGLGEDDDDAIVASLLNLSDAIGIDVVAVGVETGEQRALLAQLGCRVAQGYLLGRPAAEPQWTTVPAGKPAGTRRAFRHAPALDPVVVARIRSLMREGASLYTIAAALNGERLAHPEERRWHPRAVARAIATAPELAGPRERWTVL